MEITTIAAIAAISIAGLTAVGLSVTVIVLLVRGAFLLGQVVNQVQSLGTKVDALTEAVNDLRADIQQTNQILVGLAKHTHDADGRTIFTVPTATGR